MLKRFNPVLTVMLIIALTAGCSNETATGPGLSDAPELPPLSTMSIDLSFFESPDLSSAEIEAGSIDRSLLTSAQGVKTNFLNAAVRVLFLDVVVYSALAEPVAAFAVAAHSIPQHQSDGSWLWTYLFVEDDREYGIYLFGKDEGEYIQWRMEVSSTDPEMLLDHFVWFDGQVHDGHGYWQFYEPSELESGIRPASAFACATPGAESIRIDWEDIPEEGHRLVLLVNKAGDPAEGSTLEFYGSPSMGSVEFTDAAEGTTGEIVWFADGSGSIQWPDYNGGEKSCWDTMQNNIDCDQ